MGHLVKELTRLKRQTAAEDDGTEMLMKLLAQAKLLQQIPASARTLLSPEICVLYVVHCGRLMLKNNLTETRTVTTRPSQPSLAELFSPQSKCTSARERH